MNKKTGISGFYEYTYFLGFCVQDMGIRFIS